MSVLTVADVVTLAAIVDASRRQVPVTWEGESGDTITGTIRSLDISRGQDIRDCRVRVSATFEHWFDMADVVRMVNDGMFALDYRP